MRRLSPALVLAVAVLAGCSNGPTAEQRDRAAMWFYDQTTIYEAGGNDACKTYPAEPATRQAVIEALAQMLEGDEEVAAAIVDDEVRRRCATFGT